MNWLNLQVSLVRSPEYVGCDPVQRATWFNVLAYSAERENGGRIEGAKNWKDRQWQQTCGVTLAEVEAAAPLLTWEGNDLLVWSYPSDKQAEIQAKRKAGQESGRKRHAQPEAKTPPIKLPVDSSANGSASGSASTEGEGNRKGKERGGSDAPPLTFGLSAAKAPAPEPLEAVIPTLDEVVTLGRGSTPEIPATYCQQFHARRTADQQWLSAQGRMRDWKFYLRDFWSKDRLKPEWQPGYRPGATGRGGRREVNVNSADHNPL